MGRSHTEMDSIDKFKNGILSTPASPIASTAQIARTHGLVMLSGICLAAEEIISGAVSGIASPAIPRAKTVK